MASNPVDLIFSLSSITKLPVSISGVLSISNSDQDLTIFRTPLKELRFKKVDNTKELFRKEFKLLPRVFLKESSKFIALRNININSFLETSRQRPLFLKDNNSVSVRTRRPYLLLHLSYIRFPRKLRSFAFLKLGEKSFFLPKRMHRLVRNRLVGFTGITAVIVAMGNFSLLYSSIISFTESILYKLSFQKLLPLFFSLLFFSSRRLRKLPLFALFTMSNRRSSVLLRGPYSLLIFIAYLRFLQSANLSILLGYAAASFFHPITMPSTAQPHFSKFVKQISFNRAGKRFSPVVRSYT